MMYMHSMPLANTSFIATTLGSRATDCFAGNKKSSYQVLTQLGGVEGPEVGVQRMRLLETEVRELHQQVAVHGRLARHFNCDDENPTTATAAIQ